MAAELRAADERREMHLVLLPGMDGTGVLFRPLLQALHGGESANVVSYPPDAPFGYDELLPLVRPALPFDRPFLIVAESFSGPLALRLAPLAGPRLRGVVLCASFVSNPAPIPAWLLRAAARPLLFRAPARVRAFVLLGRHATPELVALLAEALRPVAPAVLAARLRSIAAVDVQAELRSCPCQVVSVHGSRDLLISRRHVRRIVRARPRLRPVVLDAPHLVAQVAPDEVLAVARSVWAAQRPAEGSGGE